MRKLIQLALASMLLVLFLGRIAQAQVILDYYYASEEDLPGGMIEVEGDDLHILYMESTGEKASYTIKVTGPSGAEPLSPRKMWRRAIRVLRKTPELPPKVIAFAQEAKRAKYGPINPAFNAVTYRVTWRDQVETWPPPRE